MNDNYVWVLAFDKITRERQGFTRCHINNSKYYADVYEAKNFDVKIMTGEEVDELIESER